MPVASELTNAGNLLPILNITDVIPWTGGDMVTTMFMSSYFFYFVEGYGLHGVIGYLQSRSIS